MSIWDAISAIPSSLYDGLVDIERTDGGSTFSTLYTSVPCTMDAVGGTSPMMMFALSLGATHIVHLQNNMPEITRLMRVVKGGVKYTVLHNETYGNGPTDLLVKSTAATG